MKDKPRKKKTGPPPERLTLGVEWKAAVKKSFEKKKPVKGWPKSES
jgi:hypothetical protein